MMIGKLAAVTGVPASTIRYWERVGVLPKPPRKGGQRRYSPDAEHLLAVLKLAQSCGFRLMEIRELLHGFTPGFKASRRWQKLTEGKQAELDAQIKRLQAMRRLVAEVRKCECAELTDCGRRAASVMKAAAK